LCGRWSACHADQQLVHSSRSNCGLIPAPLADLGQRTGVVDLHHPVRQPDRRRAGLEVGIDHAHDDRPAACLGGAGGGAAKSGPLGHCPLRERTPFRRSRSPAAGLSGGVGGGRPGRGRRSRCQTTSSTQSKRAGRHRMQTIGEALLATEANLPGRGGALGQGRDRHLGSRRRVDEVARSMLPQDRFRCPFVQGQIYLQARGVVWPARTPTGGVAVSRSAYRRCDGKRERLSPHRRRRR